MLTDRQSVWDSAEEMAAKWCKKNEERKVKAAEDFDSVMRQLRALREEQHVRRQHYTGMYKVIHDKYSDILMK